MTMIMGRHLYVTPKLISNLLGMKYKGPKLRFTRDEDEVVNPMIYEVPADYRDGELKASRFTKRGKHAHELVTKIFLPKTSSIGSFFKLKEFSFMQSRRECRSTGLLPSFTK